MQADVVAGILVGIGGGATIFTSFAARSCSLMISGPTSDAGRKCILVEIGLIEQRYSHRQVPATLSLNVPVVDSGRVC
jgi:hypothetical protein